MENAVCVQRRKRQGQFNKQGHSQCHDPQNLSNIKQPEPVQSDPKIKRRFCLQMQRTFGLSPQVTKIGPKKSYRSKFSQNLGNDDIEPHCYKLLNVLLDPNYTYVLSGVLEVEDKVVGHFLHHPLMLQFSRIYICSLEIQQ